MTEPVPARFRYIKPHWKGRQPLARIGDWESLKLHTDEHEVTVEDARGLDHGLDTAGFQLTAHHSKVEDFNDEAQVRSVYHQEMVDVFRRLTGADHVFVNYHFIRRENAPGYNEDYSRLLHGDRALSDLRGLCLDRLQQLEVRLDPSVEWEFAWYNAWKPIEHEVQQNPLALIDARTMPPSDVVEYWYTGHAEPNLECVPLYGDSHRFFYFSSMKPHELLVFKQLDTRPGRAVTCLHSSFHDHRAPQDALPRRSIELSVMCAFVAHDDTTSASTR